MFITSATYLFRKSKLQAIELTAPRIVIVMQCLFSFPLEPQIKQKIYIIFETFGMRIISTGVISRLPNLVAEPKFVDLELEL